MGNMKNIKVGANRRILKWSNLVSGSYVCWKTYSTLCFLWWKRMCLLYMEEIYKQKCCQVTNESFLVVFKIWQDWDVPCHLCSQEEFYLHVNRNPDLHNQVRGVIPDYLTPTGCEWIFQMKMFPIQRNVNDNLNTTASHEHVTQKY